MGHFVNEKKSFSLEKESYLEAPLKFIEDNLKQAGTDRKETVRTVLMAEEMLVEVKRHAPSDSSVRICVKKIFGDAAVMISAPGGEIDLLEMKTVDQISLDEMGDEEADRAIRSILLRSMDERLKYSFSKGRNSIRITVGSGGQSMLKKTMIGLALGIVVGLILNYLTPPAVSEGMCHYLFEPVKTVFMNALKIIIAPVVFFSIVSCIAQFKDLSELGRIGIKVMGMYLLTTFIAVFLSMGVFMLLNPGSEGFALTMASSTAEVNVDTNVDTSLLGTIVNIVPSNFLLPFVESDTLQIIFLAMIVGVAVGMIGEYSATLQNFFEACNALFLTITTMIAQFIPLAVFCSVLLMIVKMGGDSFVSVLSMLACDLLSLSGMICIYGLLVMIIGRLNPFVFFKNDREGMLTSFTLSSSSAAMPTNVKVCTDRMGISPKVCSFSIPLGATVNMDGTCVGLMTMGLFLAKAYGVAVTPAEMASLLITIVLLSLGAPGVPGSGLVCLGVVLGHLGVPVEAIGLVIGVYPFMDMFQTMSNTTGDVAVTTIVAKTENLLDKKVFYDA